MYAFDIFLIIGLIVYLSTIVRQSQAEYQIGVGIADCTGPVADINFMGYGKKQIGCGLHLRQFVRAFLFNDNVKLTVFASVDSAMMCHPVKRTVLKQLGELFPGVFNIENVILSGTHTHSTPGGFMQDVLYDIPAHGFVRQTFNALVDGIVKAITKAYSNQLPAKLYASKGELLNANINRSPTAYLLNPPDERAKYLHDVDKTMLQLQMRRKSDNKLMGAINWFAVHATSMNNTNCLISSDNVGYASILLEQSINGEKAMLGKGQFVGAFASTNLGDVSPNIRGAKCIDTGESCTANSSTCDGDSSKCIAFGPGSNMFESTQIIGERMFSKAESLLNAVNRVEITGPLSFAHQFVDMPKQETSYTFSNGITEQVHGCRQAMGYSFGAGTTDGPGMFSFHQATISSNKLWNFLRDVLFPPSPSDVKCQYPKPILINSGKAYLPYEWQPSIVSTQITLLGNFIIISVPGEFTTMSGRRLRAVIKSVIESKTNISNPFVVIAGLSNVYTSYIATYEEYQMQRYEGASTLFGPHTLTIYLNQYEKMMTAIATNTSLDPGPTPPDFSSRLISFNAAHKFDFSGMKNFGYCTKQPPESVERGETVTVDFVAGNPRCNLMHGSSFLRIERQVGNGAWETVATDANWETKFLWKQTSMPGSSKATIQWEIGINILPGIYRIWHNGNYKSFWGGEIKSYQGVTNTFQVV